MLQVLTHLLSLKMEIIKVCKSQLKYLSNVNSWFLIVFTNVNLCFWLKMAKFDFCKLFLK